MGDNISEKKKFRNEVGAALAAFIADEKETKKGGRGEVDFEERDKLEAIVYEALQTKEKKKTDKGQDLQANGEQDNEGNDAGDDDDSDSDSSNDEYDSSNGHILSQWETTRTLTPAGFLTELASAVQDEHLDLQFDYFSFHRQTRTLLEKIHGACIDYSRDWIQEERWDMLDGPEAPMLIPGIIMLAACDPKKAMNLYALKSDMLVDTRGLKAAAEIMKEFIDREGATYSNKELSMLDLRQKMGEREHGDDWEEELAILAANAGLTSTVGRLDGLSIQESAEKLKMVTMEDTYRRHEAKIKQKMEEKATEKEEKAAEKEKKGGSRH